MITYNYRLLLFDNVKVYYVSNIIIYNKYKITGENSAYF